jgi:uncharacterized membrane protein
MAPAGVPSFSPAMSPAMSPAAPSPLSPYTPATRSSNLDADGVPLSLFADSGVSPDVFTPVAKPTSQSDWHNQTGRGVLPKRQAAGSVSLSTGVPTAASRKHDPYRERNWIAGVALLLAILGIPALGARVMIDLPPLTVSIFAGAPIAVSLLAVAMSVRRGVGVVLSVIATVIAAATLAASLLVDPAVLRSIAASVVALLP